MRKEILIMLIAAASMSAIGCGRASESSLPVSSLTFSAEVSGTQSAGPIASQTEDAREITYNAPVMTTTSWYSYESGSSTLSVSLSVPKTWTLDSSVFYQDDIKVAEIVGIVTLSKGQALPSGHIQPEDEFAEGMTDELVMEESGSIAGLTYKLQVTKTYPDGGAISVWYPHTYYLSDGSHVFVVTFYSLETDRAEDHVVYEKILSSFRYAE